MIEATRLVVMVGVPFPNIKSLQLQECLKYVAEKSPPDQAEVKKQHYYEAIAMKAVNQSIGRAIRHGGDYATIALLDERYAQPNLRAKLPTWLIKDGQTLAQYDHFGTVRTAIQQVLFFFSLCYKRSTG